MLIVADVETTGLKSHQSHVIEAAVVVLDGSWNEVDSWSSLSNPGEEALRFASSEALAVNGITFEQIRQAPMAERAAAELQALLAKYPDAKIHAFNNDFDLWFLARKPWNVPARHWGECLMRASMEIMEALGALETFPDGNSKWPRLSEAAKFFGVPYEKGHRALGDARTAAKVYTAITKRRAGNDDALDFLTEARNIMEDGL